MKFRYCLITDRKVYRQPLHEVAGLAEEAGVDYFQLREKDLHSADLLEIARHLRPLLVRTRFIINGHLDVALASGADGVHLQRENIPVSVVRRNYPALIIGYSAHSSEELEMSEESGADYAFVSPIFQTRSKTSLLPPLGIDQLARWTAGRKIPVFGLGGVTGLNLEDLQRSGCAGAAGISLFVRNGKFGSNGMVIK